MNKFEKQLEKWNNGVLRGAQAKLAKALGVSTATTALWTTGKRHPSKGYVARMAELFNMDSFSVLRLFDFRTTTYPEPQMQHFSAALRDQGLEDYSYKAGTDTQEAEGETAPGNSVRLPFLNAVPANFPIYNESDIIEWWSVPRRYAQGAKYIIRAKDAGFADAQDEDDLCFVKPEADLVLGKTLLVNNKKGSYVALLIKRQKDLAHEEKGYPRFLGTIVRRIRGV